MSDSNYNTSDQDEIYINVRVRQQKHDVIVTIIIFLPFPIEGVQIKFIAIMIKNLF